MKLSASYDGGNDPAEGDRALLVKTIPAGARARRAQATVTPVDGTRGANPFAEAIDFGGTAGGFGATKTPAGGAWVEVDLHARRTLAGVAGLRLAGTSLQVDLGGAYVEINSNGGIRTPNDGAAFVLSGDSEPLPGLTVTKFKLTNPPASPPVQTSPDVTRVTVRSTPAGVSLRLGDLPAFWTRAGEMTRPETTPDFAAVLNSALAAAPVENGFHVLKLVLHTDTIARLRVALEIEYVFEQSVLPAGLEEAVLPFDLSGSAQFAHELRLDIPPGARVAAEGPPARIKGTFDATRLVYETDSAAPVEGEVEVSPEFTQAQPVTLTEDAFVTDIDFFVALNATAKLHLDLREDLDGKPAQSSLLPRPVAFELPGPAGGDEETEGVKPRWVSVRLPGEFKFKAATTYWIVLQSGEGKVAWKVGAAPGGPPTTQRTDDGGLSWRDSKVERLDGPVRAFFCLRRRPARFEFPVELWVGEPGDDVEVDLSRYESLGRVDFALEPKDLADAVNKYLRKARARACPEVEHLTNGDFEQWVRVGDALMPPVAVPLTSTPFSIGVAPTGAWAYVGMRAGEAGLLQVFDVACDVARDEAVQLDISPNGILMSPDGLHAFALDTTRLQLIDTTAHRAVGAAFAPGAGLAEQRSAAVEAVALSADGARLYVMERFTLPNDAQSFGGRRQLHVFDLDKLESALAGGQSAPADARILTARLESLPPVVGLAVSPDETRLYAATLVPGAVLEGRFYVLDLADLSLEGEFISLGSMPTALAVSPDGGLALVADAGDGTVTFIAIADGARGATPRTLQTLRVAQDPLAVAITADGRRACVMSRRALSYIDLDSRVVVNTMTLGTSHTALAVTPQGDRIYVADTPGIFTGQGRNLLYSIQVGLRQPFGWDVTSGSVAPLCLPAPFRRIAHLGAPARFAPDERQQQTPTSISQVVPVAADCSYDFSFYGVASERDAVAELFWLGADCRLAQPEGDPIPIAEVRMPGVNVSPAAAAARASRIVGEGAPLVLHRKRLRSPAGAAQAEVRFTVPSGAVGAVEAVSLVGTNEVVENSDFTFRDEGRLSGWRMTPATATGLTLVETEAGVRLRNAGASAVELIQTVPARGAKTFVLELRGRTEVRPHAATNPRLEIYWLAEGDEIIAAPVAIELRPSGFDAAAARGPVPEGAVAASLRLVVPPGATQFVEHVSLRFPAAESVPLNFYSEAPGELTLLDWRVTYERAEAAAPAPPARGLCAPTPPGRAPGGADSDGGTHFCQNCQAEQPVFGDDPMQTRSAGVGVTSRCANCGGEVVRFGGTGAASAAQGFAARPPLVTRSLLHVSALRANAALGAGVGTVIAAAPEPFAAIVGIGEVRTRELRAVGIDSVQVLAAARPEDVSRVKSIPHKLAEDFIRQARELLSTKDTRD